MSIWCTLFGHVTIGEPQVEGPYPDGHVHHHWDCTLCGERVVSTLENGESP